MSGWDLKAGAIKRYDVSEETMWSLFNYVFSDSCAKTNSYKFGLVKALLDNLFNGQETPVGVFYTYEEIFEKFAANYWNLIVKYNLKQTTSTLKLSRIETIFNAAVAGNKILGFIEFDEIEENQKQSLIKQITDDCKRYVVGALYTDFDGYLYAFDLKEKGLTLSYTAFHFMLKHKTELERLNYYSWARFLEKVNADNVLIKVIDKLELATPRREDLSIYREILRQEFEENTCFYCGKKLQNAVHVDHFIPWSFVKDDKIWNFVLACPTCNEKKNNRIPGMIFLDKIISRNRAIKQSQNEIIQTEFANYTDELIIRMCNYAKLSGLKEYLVG